MAALIPYNRGNRGIFDVGFGDVFDDFFPSNWLSRRALPRTSFKIDVEENDDAYVISADLPGIQKDEVSIDMSDNHLTVSVSHNTSTEEEDKNYIHRERSFSSMARSIYLPDVEASKIEAKLDNGVLTVTAPKEAEVDHSVKVEVK